MQAKRTSLALPPLSCSDFIKYILNRHITPTTLLICSTKQTFLEDLLSSFHSPQSPSTSQASDDSAPQDSLLIPTIHLISKSSNVHLVFVPTLPHLRAYLATYGLRSEPRSTVAINPESQAPLLSVWGLARLHRSTAEHSAQGISRTLVLAVEAAHIGDRRLMLGEPHMTNGSSEQLDDNDISDAITRDPWKEKVPLLSGSIRVGGGEGMRAGKTIEVEKILAKWCRFVAFDHATDPI